MNFSPSIQELIHSLRMLPGLGFRSAQRIALHLLEKQPELARRLAFALVNAVEKVRRCTQCRTLCETELCPICVNPKRQRNQLCVVETPMDLIAIEQAGGYQGLYFVLHGRISPLDGIGPEELKLFELAQRLEDTALDEIILATNPTVEGEATAYYLSQMAKHADKSISRLAYGIPLGGELEFTDGSTLSHAFSKRQKI